MPDATTDDPGTLDFDAYRAAVAHSVVSLDVHTERAAAFRGALHAATTSDIHLLKIAASEHAVHRSPMLVERNPQNYVKFTLLEHGNALIVQNGRESTLAAGDMTIYDTSRPYSLLFDDAAQLSIVMFPKDLLNVPGRLLDRLMAVRFDGDRGAGTLVRPFLAALTGDIADAPPHIARRLCRTATDLVETLLETYLPAASATTAPDGLTHRILDHIEDHLNDPDLGPASIAAAHFISVRHLHTLISRQGTTISTLIRVRRLERCYDALSDPRDAHRSISEIALSHAFPSIAHFSRTFRAHYGVPPTAIRNRVVALEIADDTQNRGPE